MSSASGVEKRGSAATVKACDSCRKRKRRCLWTSGSTRCTYCVQLKEECTTTHVRKPRGKAQFKKDRIAEYEHRIKSLETLLQDRSVAQPHVQEQPFHRADESIPLSTWTENLRTEISTFPSETLGSLNPSVYTGPVAGNRPELSSYRTDVLEPIITGSGDPFSVPADVDVSGFEPSADFQEVADLLQDPSFQPSVELAESIDDLAINETSDIPEGVAACVASLPAPELGASLLAEFLVDCNTVFPLYRPYTIVNHLRICYEGASDGSALAWASAYLVLGLAHRSRAMSAVATPQDNELADWYLTRILPTISGLLVAPPSLGLVQCLLGLSMLIRSSANTTPHALFTSTALRIAQTLAYEYFNVESQDNEHDAQDVEQQRRVFWLAFIQDTEEGMLSNVPTTQRREDITTELPELDPPDSLGAVKAAEGDWKINLFALRIRLVLIQAEAIEDVLALKPRRTTPQEMTAKVDSIVGKLEAWRDNEVCRMTPAELTLLLYRADVIHILSLEAAYFATVFRLRSFVTLGLDARINPFSSQALGRIAAQKEHKVFAQAERVLSFLSHTPHGDTGICWMTKFPIIAALVTVLSHHLHALTSPALATPPETPSTASNSSACTSSKASAPSSSVTAAATTPLPTADAMTEYMRILRTLGTLGQRSGDLELQRGREIAMMLYTKVETALKVKTLRERADRGK